MSKIEKLTKEQELYLVEFRQRWLDIGLCTDPADFETAEKQITFFYERLGKKKPMFFKFSSPLTCELGCHALDYILKNPKDFFGVNLRANLGANLRDNLWDNLGDNLKDNLRANLGANIGDNLGANLGENLWDNLKDNLWDNLKDNLKDNLRANLGENLWVKKTFFVNTNLWGQQDAPWIALYKFCADIGIKYKDDEVKLLNAWGALSESACWWMPYENICIISDRPSFISKDDAGRLHNETRKAVEFRDTYGLYMWHGVNVPDEWITDKAKLTPEIALKWPNVEQRRAACEILGWANVLEHPSLNPKVIDEDQPHIGTLIQVDLPDAPGQWFIKYQCGTGRWFAESVNDKKFNTALKANAGGNGWREGFGDPENFIPFIRT